MIQQIRVGDLDTWEQGLESVGEPQSGGVLVSVGPPICHKRFIHDLPPVSVRDLNRLVHNNRRRYFPETPSELNTAAEWSFKNPLSRAAVAYAIERDAVDRISALLRVRKLTLVDIVPHDSKTGLSLLPPDLRRDRRRAQLRTAAAAYSLVTFGLCVLLLLGSAAFRTAFTEAQAQTPDPQQVNLARAVFAAELNAQRVERSLTEGAAHNHGVLNALSRIAQQLDDSTVVVSLAVANGRVTDIELLTAQPSAVQTLVAAVAPYLAKAEQQTDLVAWRNSYWTRLRVGGGS